MIDLLVGHRARLNATIARKEALLYYQIVAVVRQAGIWEDIMSSWQELVLGL